MIAAHKIRATNVILFETNFTSVNVVNVIVNVEVMRIAAVT